MLVSQWLRRLNFQKYTVKFNKDGIRRVGDLRHVNEGQLTGYGMTALTERKRVMDMIRGKNEEVTALFTMQTRVQARSIIQQYLPVGDSKVQKILNYNLAEEVESILEIIGEENITGFQLLDIFDHNKDLNVVKRKLAAKVNQNELLAKGLIKEKSFGDDIKEDVSKKYPKDDIESILKSLGFQDCIPKLKEQDIADPDTFYNLKEDKIFSALDIKTEGKKFKLSEKIKEIKEKHEKELAKLALSEDSAEKMPSMTYEAIKKKATSVF